MAFKLLLVDDSRTVRRVMAKALRLGGADIEIFEAENGADALELLADTWIDLAFVDINMPVMNGVELIEAMSKDSQMSSIPVLVVSTEGSTTRMDQLKSLGISGYLRKPFTAEQFQQVISETLGAFDDV